MARPEGTREVVDVVVVGAGPCGLSAAIAAERSGLRALVIEQSCVASGIARYPTYMTFFSTAEKVAIGEIPFIVANEKPTRREALAYYRAVVRYAGIEVRQYEEVTALERRESGWHVRTRTSAGAEGAVHARAVVVATGYFDNPNRLGVPGEDLPHVTHAFREGHVAFGREALVVGGGNSAADAALELYRAGARVTLVHFAPELDRGIKPWVLPDLMNRIAEGSIVARLESRVTSIEPDAAVLATPDGALRVPAQHVYLMTGYTPRSPLLEAAGVPLDSETGAPVHDPGTMETSVPALFVAGVLAAGLAANRVFIENGRQHGALIARRLSAGVP